MPTGSLPGDRLSHKPHPGRCGGPARGFELAGLDRCPPLAALALPGDRARHAGVEVAVQVPVDSAHLGGGRPGRGRPNRPGPSPSVSRSPSAGPSSRASGRGPRANKKWQPGRSRARWVTLAGGHAGQRRRPVMRWDQPCCAGPPVGAGIPLHRSLPPRSGGPGSARAHAAAPELKKRRRRRKAKMGSPRFTSMSSTMIPSSQPPMPQGRKKIRRDITLSYGLSLALGHPHRRILPRSTSS